MTEPQDIQKDLSVPMTRANLYSLFFAVPAVVLLTGCYFLLWGKSGFQQAWLGISRHYGTALIVLVLGILVHELLHGLAWSFFGKKPLHTITFGFNLKALSPYAHSREAMTVKAYRWGAALPGLALGIFPSLLGIVSGNGSILVFGLLFTAAAGGDALVLWLIRREDPAAWVMDHRRNAGCLLLGSPNGNNGHESPDHASKQGSS